MKVKSIRNFAFAVLALSVSACAMQPDADDLARKWNPASEEYAKALESVDWNQADVIEVVLFDNHFSPMLLSLKKGQPYVLRFVNKEKEPRMMVSQDFFGSLAISGEEDNKIALMGFDMEYIPLPEKNAKTIRVVPMESGRYEFRQAAYFDIFRTGAYGVAYVE